MSEEQPSVHPPTDTDSENPRRRAFLVEMAALVIGAIAAIIPGVAAATFILNPILKKKEKAKDGDDGFTLVGTANGLKPGGDPQFFQVIGVKKDAWTTYPATSLGAVYVRKEQDGSLSCLNARCTHLGCTVKFRPAQEKYVCPCHASSFNIEGERSNEIPPRNLDSLDVELRNQDEIWVRFQNFRGGREEQLPV